MAYDSCTNVACLLRLEVIASKSNSYHFALQNKMQMNDFYHKPSQKNEVKSTRVPPEKFVETNLKPTLIRENSNN